MANEFEGCDGALWYVTAKKVGDEIQCEVDSTIYNYKDRKVEPDELGFYYHILTYKEDRSEVETLSAYIGDVAYFISNHAKAGYNGLIVKNKSVPKKDIKQMFKKILTNWEFSPKIIRETINQF